MCQGQGKFPHGQKTANIVCVHMYGSHNTVTKYRPISTVHTFAKIIENGVALQLSNYFEQNKFITESQFGFRSRIVYKKLSRVKVSNANLQPAAYLFEVTAHFVTTRKNFVGTVC